MPDRFAALQTIQVGKETTPGTPVAAGKLLTAMSIKPAIKPEVKVFRPTSRKYPSTSALGKEFSEFDVEGQATYSEIIYALASAFATATPSSSGLTTKEWTIMPPLGGAANTAFYTIEHGDPTWAEKFAYCFFNSFGAKYNRDEVTIEGSMLGQKVTTGVTMTASPTAIPLEPILGNQINMYLDTTSANLGITQLLKVIGAEWKWDDIFGTFWPLNRANSSFASHVDLAPKAMLKFLLEADTVGLGFLDALRSAATRFIRLDALGLNIDNYQTLSITGSPTGGFFKLTYKGQQTADIAHSASAATVQTALELLSTIDPGDIVCTGGPLPGTPVVIDFSGGRYKDDSAVLTFTHTLTGGSSPTPVIVQTLSPYKLRADFAVKIINISPFQDEDGIYAVEYECAIVEDPVWGKAANFFAANKQAAL